MITARAVPALLSAHHRRVARPEVTHQRLCRPPGGYPPSFGVKLGCLGGSFIGGLRPWNARN
jgi:hypothetical protein